MWNRWQFKIIQCCNVVSSNVQHSSGNKFNTKKQWLKLNIYPVQKTENKHVSFGRLQLISKPGDLLLLIFAIILLVPSGLATKIAYPEELFKFSCYTHKIITDKIFFVKGKFVSDNHFFLCKHKTASFLSSHSGYFHLKSGQINIFRSSNQEMPLL